DDTLYKEPYYTKDGCLYEEVIKNGKAMMVKLCDYLPVLRSEITYDDGTDTKKVFEVTAEHSTAGTLPPVKVTAEDMKSMTWLLDRWGALGSYVPTNNTPGKIRHAITMTKSEINFRTVYSQTGWRLIDGEWFFLMPQEDSPFTVELHGKLKSYHFGQKCSDGDLIYLTAMLDEGFIPQRLMLTLLAFTFLAPLNCFMRLGNHEPRFIVNLVGKTGTRKSSSAAVFLSFFGNFNASNMPNSFHDTANSILANIYYTKDVLTRVDDLHPSSRYGNAEMNATAQNLSRYYGDRTGRDRLDFRAEQKHSKPPTGLCLTTSEFVADISQSGLARYFILEMKEGDVDLDLLSEYQKLAEDGTLCGIMQNFVE
ncbi:MAG: hypothetical protein IJ555_12530, partial [Ruminococcus sp.]|nr:hypothetical protein [Ruminococcus sp.]